ncbi:glutathione S-transferase N-terminal domain-containing protein [Marinimicrobium sp. C6131]|uniref:glutathione S-transferase N-terminal domain-containing protein n=1 Tax=Marinimicrobium sp. C6131 TaxID=3022676 RepID=UPI00223D3180|nr:glutathione S-transferase N-terminal domain-containing protein [Marinimicrobium sp. C6131]UZJ44981.1 glutathione S-transferase N-terminal domain-containing protein [Marinimicrobium sp. C6131]
MSQPPIFRRWPPREPELIQLYSMNTPNGIKVAQALEEMHLPYEPHTVNILAGDQHTPEFLWINPNGKIPALYDPDGPDGRPISLMESAAILIYLAEKTGTFMPVDPDGKSACLQWLFFQMGHIGPMFGQFGHFFVYARDKCDHPYPVERYSKETQRLLGVLEQHLNNRDYMLGESFSIADMAIAPWVDCLDTFYRAGKHLKLREFPAVLRWLARCTERPSYGIARRVCDPEDRDR